MGTQNWVYDIVKDTLHAQHYENTTFYSYSSSVARHKEGHLWQPWYTTVDSSGGWSNKNTNREVAGFVSQLSPHLAFVTVHDAGHVSSVSNCTVL